MQLTWRGAASPELQKPFKITEPYLKLELYMDSLLIWVCIFYWAETIHLDWHSLFQGTK